MQMKHEKLASLYSALSKPVRLKILEYLLENTNTCICHIAEQTGKDQSVVFRHIQALKEAGLVYTEKENKFLMCRICDKQKAKKLLEG